MVIQWRKCCCYFCLLHSQISRRIYDSMKNGMLRACHFFRTKGMQTLSAGVGLDTTCKSLDPKLEKTTNLAVDWQNPAGKYPMIDNA